MIVPLGSYAPYVHFPWKSFPEMIGHLAGEVGGGTVVVKPH